MGVAAEADMFPISVSGDRRLRVLETPWGYILRNDFGGLRQIFVSLTAMRFVGLVLVLAAYGQWLIPSAILPGDAVVTKALITFFFGVLGAALYWTGRGVRDTELHIDLTRRELRIALCASGGVVRFPLVMPLSHVADVAVSSIKGGQARLYVLVKDREAPLPLVQGEAKVLLGLERRIRVDLRSIEDRFQRRMARAAPFKSRRMALT